MRRLCRLCGKVWFNRVGRIDSRCRDAWLTDFVGARPGSREVVHATDEVERTVHSGTAGARTLGGPIPKLGGYQVGTRVTILAAFRNETGLPLPESNQNSRPYHPGTDTSGRLLD